MLVDRSFQEPLIQEVRDKVAELKPLLDRKPRVMLQSQCGSGKTVTATKMAKSCIEKGGTVVFLVHRNFLLEQTSSTFTKFGIRHSFLAAGKPLNPKAKAFIGMIGSMKSRQGKIKPPTICFVDEASHAVAKTWKAVIEAWPETIFILLSATPGARTDGLGLSEVCDGMVSGPSVANLIERGALSQYHYYQLKQPDLSKVHTRMGDFVPAELDAEMTKAVIIGDIVSTYKKVANGTRAIYFATSIETSKRYAEAFNAAGIPAAHLDKDTPSWERKRIAMKMANGEILVMCNCAIATMGYDLAAQAGRDVTIETVGLCRPTKSFPLLVQMAMRAMRAKDYPGIILDHAGSFNEFDWLPIDDVIWTLEGCERKPREVKYIQCHHCLARVPETKACGICHKSLLDKPALVGGRPAIEHVYGEIERVEREARVHAEAQQAAATQAAIKHAAKREEWACSTLDDWIALGRRRKYSNVVFWAKMKHDGRQRARQRRA